MVSFSDGEGNSTDYTYDTRGDLTEVEYPNGDTISYTSHDAAGRVLSRTDGRGIVTSYTYGDEAGLLTAVAYTNYSSQNVDLTYDNYGRWTQRDDASGTEAYTYVGLGRAPFRNRCRLVPPSGRPFSFLRRPGAPAPGGTWFGQRLTAGRRPNAPWCAGQSSGAVSTSAPRGAIDLLLLGRFATIGRQTNGMARTDEQLMQAYRGGDLGAFDELVERYFARLTGYLRQRAGAEAEDLALRALYLAARARNREKAAFLPARATVKAWLYAIAENEFRTWMKKRGRAVPVLEPPEDERADPVEAAPDDEPGPAERACAAALRETIWACLAKLKDDDLRLMLQKMAGLDRQDIAASLGITPNAADQRLHRARLRLHACLAKAGLREIGREEPVPDGWAILLECEDCRIVHR